MMMLINKGLASKHLDELAVDNLCAHSSVVCLPLAKPTGFTFCHLVASKVVWICMPLGLYVSLCTIFMFMNLVLFEMTAIGLPAAVFGKLSRLVLFVYICLVFLYVIASYGLVFFLKKYIKIIFKIYFWRIKSI